MKQPSLRAAPGAMEVSPAFTESTLHWVRPVEAIDREALPERCFRALAKSLQNFDSRY